MNAKIKILFVSLLSLPAIIMAANLSYEPDTSSSPPPPAREFRAAWITEVAVNPDWPSQQNLTTAQQKAELISLLDRAQQLHLNAVFFQVRPACDAFYSSPIEPWSDRITGVMGRAPEPFYDPLAFAIAEAHKRGLQLHAWLNPFRAAHPSTKSPPAANHITRTHPELIRHYADQVWLDPGEPAAQARTISVVLDIIRRYDVDGIVFDDYFYPYPVKNLFGHEIDFPDDASWKKFGASSGLTRDDWRRANVNHLVQNVSQRIKTTKPWVQFGISPFGIWRPKFPPLVKGLDAYASIYADARLWIANGWVDFLAPQLYWPLASRDQSFNALLNWWRAQNSKGHHVFAALDDTKFASDEIARQVQASRALGVGSGQIHYHLRSVADNSALAAAMRNQYSQPVLVPASPWISATPLSKPKLIVDAGNNSAHAHWENSSPDAARNWLLQARTNGVWNTQVFPSGQSDFYFSSLPDVVSLRAVDRLGNLSEAAVLAPKKYSTPLPNKGATGIKNLK